MPDHRIAYSVHEAAKAAGIGLTKLREEIRAKRLIARKLGKRTLINVEDLSEEEVKMLHEHFCTLVELSKKDEKLSESHSVEEAAERHQEKRKAEAD